MDEPARRPDETQAERERRAHLLTETGVFAASLPFMLVAITSLLSVVAMFMTLRSAIQEPAMLIPLGIAGGSLALGLGLRRFQRWAQLLSILVVLALVATPGMPFVWTLPLAVIVTLPLVHRKAWHVFTPRYRDVVESTKHIKQRTPAWAWIAFAAVVAGSGAYVWSQTRALP